MLLEARGHRYEHMYSFLLASGLRLGEALALRWEDIDQKAGQLTVRHTLEKLPRTPWCLTEPKSKTGRRTIPLIAPAAAAVRAQRARNRENKMHAGPAWQELEFVFSDELGQPFSGHAVYSAFKHIAKRAGLPSTPRPHDLRHSTATYLLAAGVATQVVMVILGHSSIVVTQRYGHVLNPMMVDAAARLEGVFSGIQTAV